MNSNLGNTTESGYKQNRKLGFFCTVASAVMFGFMPFLVKSVCAEGTNTFSCVVLRYVLTIPIIYVYLKVRHVPLRITLKEFGDIVLLSIFGIGGTALLLYSSYNYLPSGISTTIHFMYPMLTTLGCVIFYKEKVGWQKLLALVLCICGILFFFFGAEGASIGAAAGSVTAAGSVVAAGSAAAAGSGINIVGILLAAASSFTYTFYTVHLGHSDIREMDDFKLMFYVAIVSGVVIGAAAQISGVADYSITPKGWVIAVAFAVLVAFIGTLGYQLGVKHIGGQNTAILSTFEPVTAVIVGVIAFSETITLQSALGSAAILAAVVLVAREKD